MLSASIARAFSSFSACFSSLLNAASELPPSVTMANLNLSDAFSAAKKPSTDDLAN
jgi:hypothetical protein